MNGRGAARRGCCGAQLCGHMTLSRTCASAEVADFLKVLETGANKQEARMNLQELLLGICLVIAAGLAVWIARPRAGQVRGWLRNENAQAYYTHAILALILCGLVNIVTGLVP
jgi:hypothetical protein